MTRREIVGPQDRFERSGAQRLRDIRPITARLWSAMMGEFSGLILAGGAMAMFVEPALVDLVAPGSLLYAALIMGRRVTLPLRLPQTAGIRDWNHPSPVGRRPRMAAGSIYLGHDLKGRELWISSEDVLRSDPRLEQAEDGGAVETAWVRPVLFYPHLRTARRFAWPYFQGGAIGRRHAGHRLVCADLAAGLQALADRPADVGSLRVGQSGEHDPVARILSLQGVIAFDIEVGDLTNDLIRVTLKQPGRPVLPFHGEGFCGLAVAKQRGDLAGAVVRLANGAQNLGEGGFGKDALQERDGVSRFDRLDLFPIAQHLDGHAGLGLEFEKAKHGTGANLADLVHNEHGPGVRSKFSRVDSIEERLERIGLVDPGVL
jgi:hypothetical protein